MKKRIVVICPGRGTYTKETLGYLQKNGSHCRTEIAHLDKLRMSLGEPTISELDGSETFKPQLHTRGEHASSLIFACSLADFLKINQEKYEIVAVTGNSMGWYLAACFAGSLDLESGFQVVNTMGAMMKTEIVGGQVIYPICDEDWRPSKERKQVVTDAIKRVREKPDVEIYPSIHLGGYAVLGGNKPGIAALLKELPAVENYPFQLINHGAFHTPLLRETSHRAFETLPVSLFQRPKIPLIDGRGNIWQPYSTHIADLYNYTLGTQVVETYDFTKAISVSLKEFAPDLLVLLGPGSTLGGSIGQILIANDWKNLKSKSDFTEMQSKDPFLIAMGRDEQRIILS